MAFSSLVALAVAALAVFGTFDAAPAFALAACFVDFLVVDLVADPAAVRPPDRAAGFADRLVLVAEPAPVVVDFVVLVRDAALTPGFEAADAAVPVVPSGFADLVARGDLVDWVDFVDLPVLALDTAGLAFVDFDTVVVRLPDPLAGVLAAVRLPAADFDRLDTVLFCAAVLDEDPVAAFRAARARSAIRPPYICKNGRAARLPRTPEWSRIRTPSPCDNAPRVPISTTRYLRRRVPGRGRVHTSKI